MRRGLAWIVLIGLIFSVFLDALNWKPLSFVNTIETAVQRVIR